MSSIETTSVLTELEQRLAGSFERSECVLVGSGTTAIYLALCAMALEKDAKVLYPDFTCETAVNATVFAGLSPVFGDVELETFNLSLESAEQAADTQEVAAAVPTHIFGHHIDVDEVAKVVGEKALLIEDCAQSYGGRYRGKLTSSSSLASVVSFGDGKLLSCLGGGAIFSDDVAFLAECRKVRATLPSDEVIQGQERTALMTSLVKARRSDAPETPFRVARTELLRRHRYGYLSPLYPEQAQSIATELPSFSDRVARRVSESQRLDELLSSYNFVRLPEKTGNEVLWRYCFLVPEKNRDNFFESLASAGVPVSKYFEPCHRSFGQDDALYPNTCVIANQIINVRFPPTREEFAALLASLTSVLKNWRKNCQ